MTRDMQQRLNSIQRISETKNRCILEFYWP